MVPKSPSTEALPQTWHPPTHSKPGIAMSFYQNPLGSASNPFLTSIRCPIVVALRSLKGPTMYSTAEVPGLMAWDRRSFSTRAFFPLVIVCLLSSLCVSVPRSRPTPSAALHPDYVAGTGAAMSGIGSSLSTGQLRYALLVCTVHYSLSTYGMQPLHG